MYKALAHASKGLEEEEEEVGMEKLAMGFEARAAAVASELKLVVKDTFYDVEESSSSDSEIELPPAFFKTTEEIDGWRRDYRKYRLGHHQGAKGEITEKVLAPDSLAFLDLSTAVVLRSQDAIIRSQPCAAAAA
jgi:hypothetical protein